ncbi:HlyD family efflux transporter periplasmic adaptor subunit [Aureitalea sp. L0-47]|uniref:efflux RND transporter periplasmic adaptor subunit n=1 Tax=Aureitalea sp. L0-47 TaxID=2816962 RepID=UPI002237E5DD|nr:HlyD family efflux transporter periplasmic adaptor subunit [Aureitalea sp. L0-47]MCW5518744.1 HlyD family efflux transporter periplasmic adaptor subunit [Aureitalea sp. L0-47]
MRKTILSILGIVFIIASFFLARLIINSNQRKRPAPEKIVKTVFVDTVVNSTVPITIKANGNLVAKRRVELYSEVQGVLLQGSKLFRAGQKYRKGEALLRMNSAEFNASVVSQRSGLYNQIASIMPDLKLDYPEAFEHWQRYLDAFDVNRTLPPLPEFSSEKEKYFINGRNIVTTYYNIKNLEQRLVKFRISAPFDGILTEALVTEGSLVRSGQKLGEYIDTNVYELAVAVSKTYANLLELGKQVTLSSIDGEKEYTGIVSRINGNVDVNSQTIDAFIEVSDPLLREGMYLEALLEAREEPDAFSMNRSLLQADNFVFVVKDTLLDRLKVRPVFFSEETVVLKDIPDGTVILNRTVPGAYEGMLVKIFKESSETTKPEGSE